jgi:phosphoenolpyruvate---glycerone phosphotransferase subunit DhaK
MAMKKFINKSDDIVQELLEGFVKAYPKHVKMVGNRLIARTKAKPDGKVAIVTLGGSGHEPALSGYVGEGLIDISVPGEIFAAPGAPKCLEAMKLANNSAGILFMVLNHEGDKMAANMALTMAAKEGIKVKKVLTSEDISNAPRSDPENRRGLIGALFVYKIAGAAAEEGQSLEKIHALAEKVADNMATIAVAVTTATHPNTGQPFFELPDDEMEVGMGQHGEAGSGRMKLKSADETADIMLDQLLKDLSVKEGEELLVILNGTGATTLMELFIIYRRIAKVLAEKKIKLVGCKIGEFLTVQEQGGFQMSIARVDKEMLRLWDAPCDAPYFVQR